MLDRTSTKEYHFTVKSLHKAGKRTGVENTNFISFNLSAGTCSIDNFNAKMKVVILQQRQDWEPPQIKDLKLVIPKDYTFMASNTIFIALGIQDKYLEKTMLIGLLYPLAHTKHLLNITSSNTIATALQANQRSQKRVGWTTIKFVGPHACF